MCNQLGNIVGILVQICLRPGSLATQLHTGPHEPPVYVPPRDGPEQWNYDIAMRVDMALLEQVETMEDKVANASMQIKVT